MLTKKDRSALSLGYWEAPLGSPLRSETITIFMNRYSLDIVKIFTTKQREVEISSLKNGLNSLLKHAYDNSFIMTNIMKTVPKRCTQARDNLVS